MAGDEIVDLCAVAPELPRDTRSLLAAGPRALATAAQAVESGHARLLLSEVLLEAPVQPSKCLAVGINYLDHIAETGREKPDFPLFFNKQISCINGPYAPIHLPKVSNVLDYEGELAFVIGRRARHVPKERAHEVIAGYTIMNDVSVRDWQLLAPTMTLGKSFDTHGPFGPWIVSADEIGDPHDLDLRTWVNGELRQESNTRHLLFDCFDQVATLSTVMTLEPGDLISTGTPSGVGAAMMPPALLHAGDVVRVEISGIGHIENTVVAEPDDTATI